MQILLLKTIGRWSWLPALLFFAMPPVCLSAHRDKLLRLVPDDMALCFVVEDLRDHSAKFFNSKAAARLKNSSLIKSLLESPESKMLFRQIAELERTFGVDLKQIKNDVFGDCVVFAFHQGKASDAQDDRGLLLLWAKEPRTLEKLVNVINKAQLDSGELKSVHKMSHRGVSFYRRTETTGKQQFYLQEKSLFVFTNRADLIHHAIDRQGATANLKKPSVLESFEKIGRAQSLFTVWVNSRAFDAELKRKAENAGSGEKQVLHTLRSYWRALDACAVSVDIQPDVEVRLTLQGRAKDLPESVTNLLAGSGDAGNLAGRFPEDSAVFFAGGVHFPAALKLLEELMAPKARGEFHAELNDKISVLMGRDFVKEVLPNLGPDFGAFLVKSPVPEEFPHAVFALRVKSGKKKPAVDKAIFNTLNTYAWLATLGSNTKKNGRIQLKTQLQGDVTVKYLMNGQLPKGLQPAFALKDGYLVFASSPAAIARFKKNGSSSKKAPLLRVSFRELSALLKGHQDIFVQALTQDNHMKKQTADRWFAEVASMVQVFDRLEIDQSARDGQITWRLRIIPAE